MSGVVGRRQALRRLGSAWGRQEGLSSGPTQARGPVAHSVGLLSLSQSRLLLRLLVSVGSLSLKWAT